MEVVLLVTMLLKLLMRILPQLQLVSYTNYYLCVLFYYVIENLHTKKVKCFTATIIALMVATVLMLVGYNSYLWMTELKSQQYHLNTIIGDASKSESFTFLLQVNSTISSATVTAVKPDLELKADVYQSTFKPPEYTAVLHRNIPKLTGKSRYNYNYLDGYQPVYLTPRSSLIYEVSISGNSSSTCPARLYLFNNQTTYDSFFNEQDPSIDSIDRSPCLFPDNGTWSFNISNSSTYYVGIAIDAGVSALGNVTVERVQYNTTGLQFAQLTSTNPSHTITTCDTGSGFLCTTKIDNTYLIVSVNKESFVDFQLKTFQVYGTQKISLFSLMLLLVVVLLILMTVIFVIAVRVSCKSCNAKGSIDNNS